MLKVLIADDKHVVLEGLKSLIPWKELNAQVVGEARNGEEALNIAIAYKPDMIISDIRMPVMDGLELFKRVHLILPEAVKILFTAYGDFSYAQEAIRYGVTDYILKPINRQKIEQITLKIKAASEAKKQIHAFFHDIYHSNFREELSKALQIGDIGAVEKFFADESEKLGEYNELLLKEWGIILFNAYYEMAAKLKGLIPEKLLFSKDSLWNELLSLGSKAEIIMHIKSLYLQTAQNISDGKNVRNHAFIGSIKRYIYENYCDSNMSVQVIADKFGMTPNYVSSIFRQSEGSGITSHITDLRIAVARELLADPSVTVVNVAHKVGYNDPRYFTRIFKEKEGLTPSEYRNIILQSLKGR